MRVTFHGAARSVTGSRHLVEANGSRILLDCGLVQGRREEADHRNRNLGFEPHEIDVVILSHAHIDHSGAIPALVKQGYRGVVHATEATTDLAGFMLRDSGHIQEKDAEFANKRMARRRAPGPKREPLYTVEDADRALRRFHGHPYHAPLNVAPGVRATFFDAGHILGSAIVRLEIEEDGTHRSIVFSGDLGRPDLPIIRDPESVETDDVLIMESTYGDRSHDDLGSADDRLAAIVRGITERGGKLIIPAFAVGRTQDLVFALQRLLRAGAIPELPVFIDSPLAISATEVFNRHPECYDEETRAVLQGPGDPFGFQRMHYLTRVEDSMELNTRPGPFIVISASGMMEAGRVLHHLRNSIENSRNGILIVGFQAAHTLGRRILRGDPVVTIFGEAHNVKAEVFVMNEFSAHADQGELVQWFRSNRGSPQDIFVVHGEENQAQALIRALPEEAGSRIHLPELHESFGLGGRHGRERRFDLAAAGWVPVRSGGPGDTSKNPTSTGRGNAELAGEKRRGRSRNNRGGRGSGRGRRG